MENAVAHRSQSADVDIAPSSQSEVFNFSKGLRILICKCFHASAGEVYFNTHDSVYTFFNMHDHMIRAKLQELRILLFRGTPHTAMFNS